MEKPAIPVVAALLMFAAVKLVAATQQPEFPAIGGTVEVEYARRVFQLEQNPELLEFARMFRETVCINLTMPVENPETFQEGSNYKINCLPWLMNFPGGSITWWQARINATSGVLMPRSAINPDFPPGSIEVRGPFNSELFITSTIVAPAQEPSTSAIYTCEVCIGRGKGGITLEELRDEGRCHNSSVVTFNIGAPPVVDDTTPNDTSFVQTGGVREVRVGASPCLSDPPDIMPPAQGGPSQDPETELRIRCDLVNVALEEDSLFPPATPGPITRRWYFNGELIYEAVLGADPAPPQEIRDRFPAIVFANQGWIAIQTDIEDIFANRTDNATFADVFGNWTCSLRNPLGTDVADFGTILRQCGDPPVLTPKGPDNATVEVPSGATVAVGCNACIPTPPEFTQVIIDCTPISGDGPFSYMWFLRREGFADTALNETGSMLTVTEEGEYVCEVSNQDITLPTVASSIVRPVLRVDLMTTLIDRFGDTITDNGCSRLRGPPSQAITTDCAFIGETLILDCSSEDATASIAIMTPDGEVVTGNGQVTLTVNITEDSGGQYRCGIMDDVCGVLGNRIEVGVYEPATIDRSINLPPAICSFGAGRVIGEQSTGGNLEVRLCCPFFGIDDPETSWRVIETDPRGFPFESRIDPSDPRFTIGSMVIDGRNTLILTITPFDESLEGTYVCRSKNLAGVDAGIVALRTDEDTAIWTTTEFSECDPPCRRGVRTRQVTCVSSRSGKRLPQIMCPADQMPADTTTVGCVDLGACLLTPRWKAYPWSPCSRGCSGGFRKRTVQCIIPRSQLEVPPSRCAGQQQPRSFEFCFNTCCTRDLYPAACRLHGTTLCHEPRYQRYCCWTCRLTSIP